MVSRKESVLLVFSSNYLRCIRVVVQSVVTRGDSYHGLSVIRVGSHEGQIRADIEDSAKRNIATRKLRDARFLELEVARRHNFDPASDSKPHTIKRVL